jgi:hypothetical protein
MINYRKKRLSKLLKTKFLTSCILIMFLGIPQPTLAVYQPPKDQKPPTGHSDSSGIRLGYKTPDIRLRFKRNSGKILFCQETNLFTWFVTAYRPIAIQISLYV